MTVRWLGMLVLLALLSSAAQADTKKPKTQETVPPAAAPLPLNVPPPPLPVPLPPPAPKAPTTFQLGIYRLAPPGVDDAGMDAIDAIFTDVAQASRRYRSVVKLHEPPKLCALEDDNCFALLGGFQSLDQILVGQVIKLQNGAAVKVRLIDVAKGKAIGQKALTVASEDRKEIKAWAEALACELLNGAVCHGQAILDADLPEMKIYVDNQVVNRTGQEIEQMRLPLGVHAVRIMVDQRTSLERKLLVSREQPTRPALYARQLSEGGISLTPAADLQLDVSGKPDLAPSAKVIKGGGKWTRPVGLSIAGAGILAAGIGAYQGTHAKSLANDVSAKAKTQNGVFLSQDLASVSSAKSAASTANVLYIVGAVLAAAGLTIAVAF